jgi:hypothetical protein
MVTELDLELADGRTLHAYDTGSDDDGARSLVVFWHHGTPNIGAPPEPLFAAAARLDPVGVLRPARLRRIVLVPRAERGLGGR